MEIILMMLTMLGVIAPVFAETVPCQEESQMSNAAFEQMVAADSEETQQAARAAEDRLFVCLDDYERKYGNQARIDLSEKLSRVIL